MGHAKANRRHFLLDAPLNLKKDLPRFCRRHVVRHVRFDFKGKYKDASDWDIQMFAQKNNYTVVTSDKKFSLKPNSKFSLLIIVGNDSLKPKEKDERLIKVSALYQNPKDYEGKIIRATAGEVSEIDYQGKRKELKYK